MTAGALAGSQALQADALDFLADTTTYGISLAVIGASLRTRSFAALGESASLLLMGVWVLGSTLYHVFVTGLPRADVMGVVSVLALAANAASVLLLMRYKGRRQRSFGLAMLAQRRDRQCRRDDRRGRGVADRHALARPDRCRHHGEPVLVVSLADREAVPAGGADRCPGAARTQPGT